MHVTFVYHGRYHLREALDLETLASLIRRNGHRVSLVYDPDTFGVTDNVFQIPWLARRLSSPEKVADRVLAQRPDLVLFSVLPSTYDMCRKTAELVKAGSPVAIVFTGLHPSLAPRRVLEDNCVDYALQGEIENVIHPLLEAVAGQRPLEEVGNLWYRRNGEIRYTQRAELVDLDALPLPDKDLFRPDVSHAFSYVAMVSRGCPYNCTYCEETCSKKLYGTEYYRRKSVDTVMAELVEAKTRYHYREVIFKDSYLSGNKPWLRELMRRYREEIGVPFKCFCTILGFDDETARLLKESGCYNIEFGLQTWNGKLRREILNRRETNEQALQTFRHCANQKLWYDVDHMFNLPTETPQDHRDGAFFYRQLDYLNRVKVHYLVYLPTAEIIKHGKAVGALPENVDRLLEDGWASDFYDQGHGDKRELVIVAQYAALYKLLPALPEWLFQWLMKGRRLRILRWIPFPLMACFQALMAMRSRDLRFSAYLRLYPVKVMRALFGHR